MPHRAKITRQPRIRNPLFGTSRGPSLTDDEGATLTILSIVRRELMADVSGRRLQSERATFAALLAAVIVGVFGTWCYSAGGDVTSLTMARITDNALGWSLICHTALYASVVIRGAFSIAKERERRTLDFLLITRMSSAEIVLGKLAGCLVGACGVLAAGFPIMLLLHVLGGVDLRLLLLADAGFLSAILLFGSWAIWISVEARTARLAAAAFMLILPLWLIVPFSASVFPPRFGIHLPGWAATVNGWLVSSGPMRAAFSVARGLRSWEQLARIVGEMIALQLLGSLCFTIGAIARLRPAYRALASGDRRALRLKGRRPVWRWRPRPPVSDDPIVWRELNTTRANGLMKAVVVLLQFIWLAAQVSGTYYFGRPALVEVWRHGYGSAATVHAGPDFNIIARMFLPGSGPGFSIDMARFDFNVFIRFATLAISLVMVFYLAASATEFLGLERARETWTSLLATPLTAHDLLGSWMRAAVVRCRIAIAALLILWTLGLATGAVHPLGYMLAILILVASIWFFVSCGTFVAISEKNMNSGGGMLLLLIFALVGSGTLPVFLPPPINPAILGSGSTPLMLWTCVLSYRDYADMLASPLDSQVQWFGLPEGQIPLGFFASWLLAIIGPSLVGLWAWRYALAHFDRLIGRPWRAEAAADPASRSRFLPTPEPGSPLAEPGGAV